MSVNEAGQANMLKIQILHSQDKEPQRRWTDCKESGISRNENAHKLELMT